jgi:thioredoxin-related protein
MMFEIFFFIVMIVYGISLLVCLFFLFKFILLLINLSRDNEYPDSIDFCIPNPMENIQSKPPVDIQVYSKNVLFAGEYFVQEKDEKRDILIKDISMTGINFTTVRPHNFSIGDIVELKFTLDNPMRTRVQEPVKIIRTDDRNVGAQYTNQSRMQKIWSFV